MTSHLDLDKFVKILGMLGSDHAGERAAAGALADKMRRDAGVSWGDVIAADHVGDHLSSIHRMIEFAIRREHNLNFWERNFLHSLRMWRGSMSEKQLRQLDAIVAKLARSAA